MIRMRREQWLDLAGYEVTVEKTCFKSLSEWRSRISRANVGGETVPDCGAGEGEGPFSENLSVCGCHTKREVVRRWAKLTRECVFTLYFWQVPGTTFRKEAITQRWDLVLNPTWCWKPMKGIENRSDVMLPTASDNKPGSSIIKSVYICVAHFPAPLSFSFRHIPWWRQFFLLFFKPLFLCVMPGVRRFCLLHLTNGHLTLTWLNVVTPWYSLATEETECENLMTENFPLGLNTIVFEKRYSRYKMSAISNKHKLIWQWSQRIIYLQNVFNNGRLI